MVTKSDEILLCIIQAQCQKVVLGDVILICGDLKITNHVWTQQSISRTRPGIQRAIKTGEESLLLPQQYIDLSLYWFLFNQTLRERPPLVIKDDES